MNELTLQALEAGYLLALQMPHDALRVRNQTTLCLLRDAIAEGSGRDSQEVQESFEEMALKMKLAGNFMEAMGAQ